MTPPDLDLFERFISGALVGSLLPYVIRDWVRILFWLFDVRVRSPIERFLFRR